MEICKCCDKQPVTRVCKDPTEAILYPRDAKEQPFCDHCYEFALLAAERVTETGEEGVCNVCERWTPYGFMEQDPFIAEIRPDEDNPEVFWCQVCYERSADDI